MRKRIPACLAALCLSLSLAAHAAAPGLPDTQVRDAAGASVALDRAIAGRRAVVILLDPAWSEAGPWLARVLANVPAAVLEETVVVLASPQPNDRVVDLGLARYPAVRVFTDRQGLLAKGGKVRVLPSVLGVGPDGTVRAQLAGAMAAQLDLQAFSRHLRLAISAAS